MSTSTATSTAPEGPAVFQDLLKEQIPSALNHMWIMFYRHGMNANLTKGFFYKGSLFQAQERAKDHCKIMGYKYIFIRPMICNLEEEETYKLGSAREGEIIP